MYNNCFVLRGSHDRCLIIKFYGVPYRTLICTGGDETLQSSKLCHGQTIVLELNDEELICVVFL